MTSTTSSAIDSLLRERKDPKCLRVGVAGGSGSGKSTVCDLVRTELPSCRVEILALDRFFKPSDLLPRYYSHYHQSRQPDYNAPDSLMVEDMLAHCRQISVAGVIIFDGHFALYYPEMRELMDLRCFVDCDMTEMLKRRTARNLAKSYGGDRENILAYNRECVVPGYEQFIQPTRKFADIVIPNGPGHVRERDAMIDGLCRKITSEVATESA